MLTRNFSILASKTLTSQTSLSSSFCIVSHRQHSLSFGMETKLLPLSLHMVSDKVILSLLTYSSSAWINYLFLSTMQFIKVIGSLLISLPRDPDYPTSYLQMMSFCLPRLETLNFVSSKFYLTGSARFLDWRSTYSSPEPSILQALLKKKLTLTLLSPVSNARPLWISIWAFQSSKAGLRKIISISSLRKCKLDWQVGRIDSSIN